MMFCNINNIVTCPTQYYDDVVLGRFFKFVSLCEVGKYLTQN